MDVKSLVFTCANVACFAITQLFPKLLGKDFEQWPVLLNKTYMLSLLAFPIVATAGMFFSIKSIRKNGWQLASTLALITSVLGVAFCLAAISSLMSQA